MGNTWYFSALKYASSGHKELLILGWYHIVQFPTASSHCPQDQWHSPTRSHHQSFLPLVPSCQGCSWADSAQSMQPPPWWLRAGWSLLLLRAVLHCSVPSTAESPHLPPSCHHQTTWLLSQFIPKENILCKLGTSTRTQPPFPPSHQKHTRGSLRNLGVNQHSTM